MRISVTRYAVNILLVVAIVVLFLGAACMYMVEQTAHASPINSPDGADHEHDHGGPEKLQHGPIRVIPSEVTWKITYSPGYTYIGPGEAVPSHGPSPELHHIRAAERAFQIWDDLNDNLNFKRVGSDVFRDEYDFEVIFMKEPHWEGNLGLADLQNWIITVYLGNYDCKGRYIEWNSNTLTTVTMHEIGHLLNLEHHPVSSHLMYGAGDKYTQDPFDTMGLNIPERLPEYESFVGQNELIKLSGLVNPTHLGKYKLIHDALDCYNGTHLWDSVALCWKPLQNKIDCYRDHAPDKVPDPDDVAPAPGMVPLEIALGLVNEYGTHQRTMEDRLDRLDNNLKSVNNKMDEIEQATNTLKTTMAIIQKQISDFNKTINDLLNRVLRIDNTAPTEKLVTLNISAWNDSDGDGIRDIGETAAPNILIITHTSATNQSNLLFTGTDGTVSRDDLPAETFYAIAVPPDGKTASTHPFEFGNSTIYGVLKVDDPTPGSTHQMELGIK